MRAVGIPVRIVNGITLKKPYDVNRRGGVLTFRMGQGRHAWIEVWFPDLGWVPFDPHQSALFVANRFVKIEVGIDNSETVQDGRLRWTRIRGSRANLRASETINADFPADSVALTGTAEKYGPRNLLLCPPVVSDFRQIVMQEAAPLYVVGGGESGKMSFSEPLTVGNLDLPANIDFAAPPAPVIVGNGGRCEQRRTFYVETAEYVTSKRMQFVQAAVVGRPLKLESVGVALHRFGGSGSLWIDLYEDREGLPGAVIAASEVIDAATLSLVPGYRWQDFSFSTEEVLLMPGLYWIGLGYTGDSIINWFYSYGKPVGPLDGTRYRYAYGGDWSGALSYEFNYRVRGKTVP